jgi:uncharacterized protein (DUF4415 family)
MRRAGCPISRAFREKWGLSDVPHKSGYACAAAAPPLSARESILMRTLAPPMPPSGKAPKVVMPHPKEIVTIRLDADLLRWFRQHPGYQTRINAILRAYMKAQDAG